MKKQITTTIINYDVCDECDKGLVEVEEKDPTTREYTMKQEKCDFCDGTGFVPKEKTVTKMIEEILE